MKKIVKIKYFWSFIFVLFCLNFNPVMAKSETMKIGLGTEIININSPKNYIWVDPKMQLELYLIPQRYQTLKNHVLSTYRPTDYFSKVLYDKYMFFFYLGLKDYNYSKDEFITIQKMLQTLAQGRAIPENPTEKELKLLTELNTYLSSWRFNENEGILIGQRLKQARFVDLILGQSFILQMPVDGPSDDLTGVEIDVHLLNGKMLGFIYYQPVHKDSIEEDSAAILRAWKAETINNNKR